MALAIEFFDLDTVSLWDQNPKLHNMGAITDSIRRYGFRDAPIFDKTLGVIVAGNGRTQALRAMRDAGLSPPQGIRLGEDGRWLVPVQVGVDAASPADARAFALDHNNLTLSGGDYGPADMARLWDRDLYLEQLERLAEEGSLPVSADDDDLAALRHALAADDLAAAAATEAAGAKDRRPSPRNLPLDAFFTYSNLTSYEISAALAAGLQIGTCSTEHDSGRTGSSYRQKERWAWRFAINFVDNGYRSYDHAVHLGVVADLKPKYATVRDIMTRDQCEAAGIAYYSLDQVLRWAEELEQHAQHVIVIPKYDCLADIPERYVLGYSVPTSHGGTPMPVERFRGRRVHLLGGSWKAQLSYLALLGEDVVSLDFNMTTKLASYGIFVYPDGSSSTLSDIGIDTNDHRFIASAISFGHIGRALYDLYHPADAPEPTVPEVDEEALARLEDSDDRDG